ncbi:MAG: hypothetical protein ACXWL5_02760 [Candidatus Chromulinivorax sp.]
MKYNKFLILLLIFQTTLMFSSISIQQAAQAVIHRDLATLSQYAQQGGDFTAQVPEYNNYNLFELSLITVNPVIIDFILKQEPYIKPNSLDFVIAPLSFYNFNPNYNRQDQIDIILKLLYGADINIFFTNVLEYHESIIENQTHLLELSYL